MAAIGIDLGTTNTVVAAVRDGRASALRDKSGNALIASTVSFPSSGKPVVGQPAKDLLTKDPRNTVFSVKRLIGRAWDTEAVQSARKKFPFELVEGPGKATLVRAQGTNYTLPEISGFVLEAAKDMAQSRLGEPIRDAVITVPANFNDLQRASTKSAAALAGLEVLRILNEPTAAALAYGFGKKGRERIAVYDFGGGTFDVTILELSENVFEVVATSGDTFLGGDDIDGAIVDRMVEQLTKDKVLVGKLDLQIREGLRRLAEGLKWDLSSRSSATATLDAMSLGPSFDTRYEFSLRRSEFEQLAEPLVNRTLAVCKAALEQASLNVKDLDEVLLVGGSTRIPLVRRRISSFFGKMPQSRINPDEVVAIGAAIQAMALETRSERPLAVQVDGEASRRLSSPQLANPQAVRPEPQAVRSETQPGRGRSTLMGVGIPEPGISEPGTTADDGFEVLPSGLLEMPEELLEASPSKKTDGSVVFQLADLEADLPASIPPPNLDLPALPKSSAPPVAASPDLPAVPDTHRSPLRSRAPKPDVPGLPAPVQRPSTLAGLPSPKPTVGLPEVSSAKVGLPATRSTVGLPEVMRTGLPAPQGPGLPTLSQPGLPTPAGQTGLPRAVPSGQILPEVRRDRETDVTLPLVGVSDRDDDEFDIAEARKSVRPEAIPDLSHDSQIFRAPSAGDASIQSPLDRRPVGRTTQPGGSVPPGPAFTTRPLSRPPMPVPPRAPLAGRGEPQFGSQPHASHGSPSALHSPSNALGHEPLAPFSQVAPFVPGEDQVYIGQSRPPLLLDVTPLSLGVEVVGGFTDRLIERNSPIPCEKTATFSTSADDQTQVRVRVCQGEERTFEQNTVLGEVVLSGLPRAARGQTRVNVTFLLDENGMLQVQAIDTKTGARADAVLRLVGVAEGPARHG